METVDSVRIDWPNGHVDVITGLGIDSLHIIEEGQTDLPNATSNSLTSFQVHVSPNPFSEQLSIELDNQFNSPLDIKLMTSSGSIVAFRTIEKGANKITLDLDEQTSTGLYFLQIISDTQIYTEKVIKF